MLQFTEEVDERLFKERLAEVDGRRSANNLWLFQKCITGYLMD